MNYSSLFLTLVLCLVLIISSRRFFLFPFIMAACFVPMNQDIIVLNLHFTLLRILIVSAVLKLILSGSVRTIQWNKFDKLILAWSIIGSLIYIIQYQSFSAVIYKSGEMVDTLGMYWLFRQILCNWEDVFDGIKLFAIFALITAPFIALEHFQETSLLSFFGPTVGQFHRGRFRAAGSFPHYIILGTFWASLLPYFYAQIKKQKNKLFYWVAIIAALTNVYFSASSTPIMTVIAIIIFWRLYNYRKHGETIFRSICCVLLMLHIVMKAPVWHLMSRADIFEGSTGWHRYFLFNNFVNYWTEWFMLGTKSTAHWGNCQSDITNQFVLQGVRGGIVTLVMFVILMYNAIKIPGKYSLSCGTPEAQWMSWGICVVMLGHFVTFWGVSYFGQMNMLLTFAFALVGFTLEQSIQNNACEPLPTVST